MSEAVIILRMTGGYSTGHTYDRELALPAPAVIDDEWWEDNVFEHTGDDVTERGVEAWYEAEVIASPIPEQVGQTKEWT